MYVADVVLRYRRCTAGPSHERGKHSILGCEHVTMIFQAISLAP